MSTDSVDVGATVLCPQITLYSPGVIALYAGVAPSPLAAAQVFAGATGQFSIVAPGGAIISLAPTAATPRSFDFPDHNGTIATIAGNESFTNKLIQGATNTVECSHLRTAGSPVSVAGAAAPTAGQVLTAVNATAANWQTPAAVMANPAFTLQPNAVAALLEWTTVAYFPWVAARHAGYTPTIVYWNSATATSLDIRLYDDTNAAVLGSELGVVTPGPHSFTCVDPVGNSSVVLQVKKNGGGTSPQIYGVLIYFD